MAQVLKDFLHSNPILIPWQFYNFTISFFFKKKDLKKWFFETLIITLWDFYKIFYWLLFFDWFFFEQWIKRIHTCCSLQWQTQKQFLNRISQSVKILQRITRYLFEFVNSIEKILFLLTKLTERSTHIKLPAWWFHR